MYFIFVQVKVFVYAISFDFKARQLYGEKSTFSDFPPCWLSLVALWA